MKWREWGTHEDFKREDTADVAKDESLAMVRGNSTPSLGGIDRIYVWFTLGSDYGGRSIS